MVSEPKSSALSSAEQQWARECPGSRSRSQATADRSAGPGPPVPCPQQLSRLSSMEPSRERSAICCSTSSSSLCQDLGPSGALWGLWEPVPSGHAVPAHPGCVWGANLSPSSEPPEARTHGNDCGCGCLSYSHTTLDPGARNTPGAPWQGIPALPRLASASP